MLALIQQVEPDTVPELGRGLLRLARGDSSDAVEILADVAAELPAQGGRGDVFGFAGRIAVNLERPELAERLLTDAIATDTAGIAAPAAEYELARAYRQMGRQDAALQQLEHLILAFPESAMLPLARRLYDQIRMGR